MPGMSVFQRTFSVSLQVSGSAGSSAMLPLSVAAETRPLLRRRDGDGEQGDGEAQQRSEDAFAA